MQASGGPSAGLDAAYNQAAYAPNREQFIKRRIRDSELTRLRIGEPERVAYGQAEIERLDIYRTKRDAAPVFVFIHGGAWRSGRSKDFATPAEMFLAAGVHSVVPDFAWVRDVGGSLMVLADQVRRAIAWVYDHAAHFGVGDHKVRRDATEHARNVGRHCAVAAEQAMTGMTPLSRNPFYSPILPVPPMSAG